MSIPVNLIIGNCISAIAAFFTARSSWARDTWHIYMYQVLECLFLAIASIFFNSYVGIVSLLACALRNYLAAKGKLDRKATLICLFLVVVPGILVNNRGYIGYIIIVANLIYTIGMWAAKKELAIKWNMIINLSLWLFYEILIIDIPSMLADGTGLVVAIASLFRMRQSRRASEKEMAAKPVQEN